MGTAQAHFLQDRKLKKAVSIPVILYGSYARGTQTVKSDVDIAVMLFSKPPRNIVSRFM